MRSISLYVVVLCYCCWYRVIMATSEYPNPAPKGNSWAPCFFAAEQIAAEGNGSTYGSCLACDPTSSKCPPKCQSLIDALYESCDGVYAPQDLYFDPAKTLDGYWNDHIDKLRIYAQRCGCNPASTILTTSFSGILVVLASILYHLLL